MESTEKHISYLKRYLLGDIAEDQARDIGERMLIEDEYVDQVDRSEDELIEDYLDDSLSSEDRARFENHFLNAPEHRERLRFAEALRKHVEASHGSGPRAPNEPPGIESIPSSRLLSSRVFKLAVAAAIIIVAGVAAFRLFRRDSDLEKGQARLKESYKDSRPLKARISLLDWAPFVDTKTARAERRDSTLERSAGILLEQALKDNPSPATEHAFGEFNLATKHFDEAVKHLQAAAQGDPGNVSYRSDLGAALVEKAESDRLNGKADDAQDDLEAGLEELDSALKIDPDFTAALFNRALCLEGMQRWREAEEAWSKYLSIDQTSGWAEEARKRFEEVRQKANAR